MPTRFSRHRAPCSGLEYAPVRAKAFYSVIALSSPHRNRYELEVMGEFVLSRPLASMGLLTAGVMGLSVAAMIAMWPNP